MFSNPVCFIRKAIPMYTAGCKRLLLSNKYYSSLAEPSLEIITDAIHEITETSVIDCLGVERPVDVIIFGTGFITQGNPRANTPRGSVVGRNGRDIGDEWDALGGAEVYY